ncbi:CCA tRNA nucleotidyltransferase [Patescibacteria group bacterium]|nr:CCA tRNA nucleotidyltransferase [Patescibacteria group bacterium]
MQNNFPKLSAFPSLLSLSEEFPNAEIFLVGGAVRDILLGRKLTDIDILVRNISGDDLEEFLAEHGRVVFAGKNFGVWKFNEIGRPRNEIYDIALPRTEFSMHKQGIYQDFKIKTDPRLPVEKDLERRDFTVNAMAYNLDAQELIDPHKGQEDLEARLIRSVGNPEERFQEDYSRMLRALRFSLQLDFEIEEQTLKTIKQMMPNINNEVEGKRVVPYEVISEEFLKSLKSNPVKTLKLWDECNALTEYIPELLKMKKCEQPENWHTEGDVWNHTLLGLEKLYSQEFKKEFQELPDLKLIIAVLFHDIGKPYTIQTPKKDNTDRIRFDEHDIIGEEITKQILERVKISAPPEIGLNPDCVSWLVGHHMLLVHGKPDELNPKTIEKYFFNPDKPSKNLLKLILIDGLATIDKNKKSMTDLFHKLCERISEIKKITGSHGNKLVKPLINGKDVIETLGLKPGERIGEILEDVRQKQLDGELKSRESALDYLKKL